MADDIDEQVTAYIREILRLVLDVKGDFAQAERAYRTDEKSRIDFLQSTRGCLRGNRFRSFI
jgi:hypothetical protein